VTFDNATCPCPFCSPSRASLVTGLYPHSHGIVYNVNKIDYPTEESPASQEGIHPGDITTEKLLNAEGYQTHQYGKWHLSEAEGLPYFPDQYREHIEYLREMTNVFKEVKTRPRDEWMEWYDWALPVDVSPAYRVGAQSLREKWEDSSVSRHYMDFAVKAGRLKLREAEIFDYRVANHAIARLNSLKPGPFMITCSLNWPHDPNVAPSPYYDDFDPDRLTLRTNREVLEDRFRNDLSRRIVRDMGDHSEVGLRELLRIYFATIRFVDDQIGRILNALEKSGRARDTIVMFVADYGDMAGGHGMFWKSTSAFYDEIARIPFLLSYPGRIKPGKTRIEANTVDIMPTLLDLAGYAIPHHVQGNSLAPYLLGKLDPAAAPAYRFCERVQSNSGNTRHVAAGTPASFMVRGGGWKYLRYADGEEFLYHLTEDPGETRNLVAQPAFRNKKAALSQELEAWLDKTGYPKHGARV